jgi:hypothetical protein
LIQKELQVIWGAVKLDGQWLNCGLEELGRRRLSKVEDVRVREGWSQCKWNCWSRHDEVLDLKALGLLVNLIDQAIGALDWCLVKHCWVILSAEEA